MNTRLAKKIWSRQWHRYSNYWWIRVTDYLLDIKYDHRIRKAIAITKREKIPHPVIATE